MDKKTGGIVGEAKYLACCFSKGDILVELDHDDYLLPRALENVVKAFNKFPDAGFCYSECAEIDENYQSRTYGDGFAFGYGHYIDREFGGKTYKSACAININPRTIRHIVGVPNHLRAWRRSTYFKVGGHNRRLSIADDYELIVRTFLDTMFVKIPDLHYLQFYHDNNTQNKSRSDIQRRVRTISLHYNDRIKSRFEQLGKEDWCWNTTQVPWNAESKFGTEENFVNYTLEDATD